MSTDEFHVHGVHDHALEHAAERGAIDTLPGRVAALSAVLATLGALMTFAGGDTQANAQLYKNTATITKTHENDKWNEYQAEGLKYHLSKTAADLQTKPDKAELYLAEAQRYRKQQAELKDESQKLEEEVQRWDERSEQQMHVHHRWAMGATAMQIAIALSAIVLLSRKIWLLYGVALVGAIGLGFGAMGLLGI